jgi:hypothetical protein
MGIPLEAGSVGGFTSGQASFLEFHRDAVFLRSQVNP